MNWAPVFDTSGVDITSRIDRRDREILIGKLPEGVFIFRALKKDEADILQNVKDHLDCFLNASEYYKLDGYRQISNQGNYSSQINIPENIFLFLANII